MRGSQIQVLLVAAVATACASASPPPSQAPRQAPPPSARAVRGAILELTPLTISFRGHPIARLRADGRSEAVGPNSPGEGATFVPGPTLHADGTVVLTKGGFTARVERDGAIYVVSPPGQDPREHLFGRIAGDQLELASSTMPWAARIEGTTLVFNGGTPPNEIEGATDARARHTALVMTAAFFIDMSISSN